MNEKEVLGKQNGEDVSKLIVFNLACRRKLEELKTAC
jgi:hypothetical protein